MTRTELRARLFSNHITPDELTAALRQLKRDRLVCVTENATGGRPEILVTRTSPEGPPSGSPATEPPTDGDDGEAA
jgi:hypothetical protein